MGLSNGLPSHTWMRCLDKLSEALREMTAPGQRPIMPR